MTKLPWQCEYEDCELKKEGNLPYCGSHNAMFRREARKDKQPKPSVRPLQKSYIRKISDKQADINERLHEVYETMDAEAREKNGGTLICEAYPAGDYYIIDHSHTISRDRCKKLGHPEWIYESWNIEHSSRQAHEEWDHYKPEFTKHANFDRRMGILRLYDPHDYERRMEIWATVNQPKETV